MLARHSLVAAFVVSLAVGVWAETPFSEVVSGDEARQVCGGGCWAVFNVGACDELKQSAKGPEMCPGTLKWQVTVLFAGNTDTVVNGECTTPCGLGCGIKTLSWVDCQGTSHDY